MSIKNDLTAMQTAEIFGSTGTMYVLAVQMQNGCAAPLEGDGRRPSPFKLSSAGGWARKNTDSNTLILRAEKPLLGTVLRCYLLHR